MKTFKVFLILAISQLIFSRAYSSDMNSKFQDLEQKISGNENAILALLLKPYGDISEFTLHDESTTKEICLDKTIIRASEKCNKKSVKKEQLHFADGKKILCRIDNNFANIRCLPK